MPETSVQGIASELTNKPFLSRAVTVKSERQTISKNVICYDDSFYKEK